MSQLSAEDHKLLDVLHHIAPYLAGVFFSFTAMVGFWWRDRQAIHKRVVVLEKLAEHAVTQAQLYECRDDVRTVDEKNLQLLFGEIKALREEHNIDAKINAQQHMDILATVTNQKGTEQ